MKYNKLKQYLRQNKPRKNGLPGTYSIRLLWLYDRRMAPKKIERGLGTNIESEALQRASLLLRFLYSLGYQVSNRLRVSVPKGKSVPLKKALPDYEPEVGKLPLFAQNWDNLPPFPSVDVGCGHQ